MAATHGEQLSVFDDWMSSAPDAWVRCKAGHHLWDEDRGQVVVDKHVYIETVECLRKCGVTRTYEVSRTTGLIVGWASYSYPPGYVTTGGGMLDSSRRGELRLERFMRAGHGLRRSTVMGVS